MRSSRGTLRWFLVALVATAGAFLNPRAEAQGFGAPVLSVLTASQPLRIFPGDFDGDGNQDLLYLVKDPSAGIGQASIDMSIAFGDGAGNFTAPVGQGSVNPSSLAVTVADFDGDGIDDFAFAIGPIGGATQATYEVWFGTRQRTIRNGPVNTWLTFGTNPPNYTAMAAITLGGIDTRGFVLLDPANALGQVFYTPPGAPAGTEVPEYQFPLPDGAGPILVTDVNQDGIPDLVVLGLQGNCVDVFLGTGSNPVFSSPLRTVGAFPLGSMLVQDMNRDGIPDLLLSSASGRVEVFAGNGDGTFQTSSIGGTSSTDASAGDGGHLIAVADVNGDGILDLLTDTPLGVSVELGTASGNYTLQGVYPVGPGAGANGQYEAAAFKSNGVQDVAVDAPAGIEILFANATGNTLTASPEPSTCGTAFTLTATLAPAAGGTVQFAIDGTSLGTANVDSSGVATWPVPSGNTYAPGAHVLTAGWVASGHALAVLITGSHTVSSILPPPTIRLSAGPPTAFEAAIAVSLSLATGVGKAAPTGTVTFSIPAHAGVLTSGPVTIVNGIASYTFASVTPNTSGNPVLPGSNIVTAAYSGDTNYGGTSVTAPHIVNLGVTTVTLTAAPPTPVLAPTYFYGQPINGFVNFAAQDSQFPLEGTWEQLSNGAGVPGCTALSMAGSSCPYGYPTLIDAGNYVWVEQYNGGPANGDPVNGTGDSTAYSFTVLPDTTSVSALRSSLNPAPVGTAVTFTVTLTGNVAVPTGTVQFLDGTGVLGTGTLTPTGQASFTTSLLTVGSHPITAVYAPTQDFNGITSAVLTQVIVAVPVASTVTLTSNVNPSLLGQPVTFTAAASVPGPFPFLIQSGTITFLDGPNAIGTGAIDRFGRATFTTSSLALGSHAMTASYPGGTGSNGQAVAASTSAVLTQVVGAGMRNAPIGFTLTVTPNPVTLKPGSTSVELVTVQPLSGFSQPVALHCTGTDSSNELGCDFLEQTIPAGGGATTLDLTTTASYPCGGSPTRPYVKQAALSHGCGSVPSPASSPNSLGASHWSSFGFGGALAAGLLWLPWARRRRPLLRHSTRWFAVIALAAVAGLSGCGNCTNLGTRPGHYQIVVSATAGNLSQSVQLKIEVLDP